VHTPKSGSFVVHVMKPKGDRLTTKHARAEWTSTASNGVDTTLNSLVEAASGARDTAFSASVAGGEG
jgi:hypothetical protein